MLAQPTFENASFPFAMPNSPLLDGFSDPFPALPSPKTYSHFEVTFGRRLQRFANERAYALIMSPNPDPQRFARVFASALCSSRVDKIRERLRASPRPLGPGVAQLLAVPPLSTSVAPVRSSPDLGTLGGWRAAAGYRKPGLAGPAAS